MSSDHPQAHGDDWVSDLFGRHSGAVLAYARRRLDSVEDAEDVVVEVFATAWRRRDDVPEEAALPWLYATAANVIAHVIRSEARRTRLGTRLASVRPLRGDDDPAQSVVESESAHAAVAAAMDDLAESDAELLRLWAWEGLAPTEIAAVLGCSPGTARTRMHRARARLREALTRRGLHGPGIDGPGTEPVEGEGRAGPDPGDRAHDTTLDDHPLTGSEDPR